MIKLSTFLILFLALGTQTATAQKSAPPTLREIMFYIERLSILSYRFEKFTISKVELEGKNLMITYSDGEVVRKDLQLPYPLKITKLDCGYTVSYDISETKILISCLQLENDAKRLKQALEHLIKILKTEQVNDPFAE